MEGREGETGREEEGPTPRLEDGGRVEAGRKQNSTGRGKRAEGVCGRGGTCGHEGRSAGGRREALNLGAVSGGCGSQQVHVQSGSISSVLGSRFGS